MEQKVTGYLTSKHIFGRSMLVRHGRSLFYLRWQWKKNNFDDATYMLSVKEYNDLKKLLLSIKSSSTVIVSEKSNSIVYTHYTNASNYMRVKRYLIKNNILKEERKHGNRITTSS